MHKSSLFVTCCREVGTIGYRSGSEWANRFGHRRAHPNLPPDFCPDFLIETYLDRQGEKICTSYDPNSLLCISKVDLLYYLMYMTVCVDTVGHGHV